MSLTDTILQRIRMGWSKKTTKEDGDSYIMGVHRSSRIAEIRDGKDIRKLAVDLTKIEV